MAKVSELFIQYDTDKELVFKNIIEKTCKNLTSESKSTLRKKIFYEYDYVYPNSKYRSIEQTFNNGTKINVLIIEKGLTTFELNEGVLECFKEDIKTLNTISYNIQCVTHKDQTRLVKSLSALEELLRFEIPKFGKKRGQNRAKYKIESGYYTDIDSNEVDLLIKKSKVLAENNNLARELCYLPPNHLDSRKYVARVNEMIAGRKDIKYEFYDVEKLKKLNANLFLAVSQADLDQGCGIVKLSYKPKSKNKTRKRVTLIGKGVVYDSGGLDLKTEGSLQGMHRDMTGSAVALASFLSLVENKVNLELNCYLPILENKISHNAYRTGDIIETMDGTAVEILNTDAEGRLAIADSVLLAKKARPHLIIDYATLTGTAIDALGGKMAATFTNDKNLEDIIKSSGEISGERVCNFPILSDIYRNILNSEQADIKQLTDDDCDHIVGAAFLKYFMGNTSFIHMDIGCEHVDGGLGLINTDVTGFGVFYTNELIKNYIKQENSKKP